MMTNQTIHIHGLKSPLLCPMQCHLNDVHISDVPKFLAKTPNVTTHAIQLADPFDTAPLLVILFHLCSTTSYFDVYYPSIAEYENEEIPKIHFTVE